jgi:hypothetical protein
MFQILQERGLSLHADTPISTLAAVLCEAQAASYTDRGKNTTNQWRDSIIAYLLEHWSIVAVQLKCHAKNLLHREHPDPRPCYKCTDAQVHKCRKDNEETTSLLATHQRRQKEDV